MAHIHTNLGLQDVYNTDMFDDKWLLRKFAYDADDNLEYIGMNLDISASDSDSTWTIYRLTWDASDNISAMRKVVDEAWSSRVTLSWS